MVTSLCPLVGRSRILDRDAARRQPPDLDENHGLIWPFIAVATDTEIPLRLMRELYREKGLWRMMQRGQVMIITLDFSYSIRVPGVMDSDSNEITILINKTCPTNATADTCGTFSDPTARKLQSKRTSLWPEAIVRPKTPLFCTPSRC